VPLRTTHDQQFVEFSSQCCHDATGVPSLAWRMH
jgi:hypothetical protein